MSYSPRGHKESDMTATNTFTSLSSPLWASQVALVVKNPVADAGDLRDAGSIPDSERSHGGGHGNPLQYSCLESPLDRGLQYIGLQTVGHD